MEPLDIKNVSIASLPVKRKNLYYFIFLFLIIFFFSFYFKINSHSKKTTSQSISSVNTQSNEKEWHALVKKMLESGHNSWKYKKVTHFFYQVTPLVIKESLRSGIPPASILSIACLESGYGTGYIASVSGNILSLNVKQGEVELPPLTVPISKDNEIIIENRELKKRLAKGYALEVIQRPPSQKKDYRPFSIAGTNTYLDYFVENPLEKLEAWQLNIQDFIYGRIQPDSPIPAYRECFQFALGLKKSKSLKMLISAESAKKFLSMVGGKPLSFNEYPSWREKTVNLVETLGLESYLNQYLLVYRYGFDLQKWQWDLEEKPN